MAFWLLVATAAGLQPKVAAHARQCFGATFTCIDCSQSFDTRSVQAHTTCVTEKEKYVDGVTKTAGYRVDDASLQADVNVEILGKEYLSTRPPWKCTLCNVNCTSESTMLAHAAGQKHRRRARAAAPAKADGVKVRNGNSNAAHDPSGEADDVTVEAGPHGQPSQTSADPEVDGNEVGNVLISREKQKGCIKCLDVKDCNKDDIVSEAGQIHCSPTEVGDDLGNSCKQLAPVVRKLIRKHGGTMNLNSLIGAISKKKKRRLGLTGSNSMTQVLEAICQGTAADLDVLIVQRQPE